MFIITLIVILSWWWSWSWWVWPWGSWESWVFFYHYHEDSARSCLRTIMESGPWSNSEDWQPWEKWTPQPSSSTSALTQVDVGQGASQSCFILETNMRHLIYKWSNICDMMFNLPVTCATLFQWQCHVFHGSHPINWFSRTPMGFLRPGMVLGAQRCRMDPWKTESERDQSQTCTSNRGIACVCFGDRMQIVLR